MPRVCVCQGALPESVLATADTCPSSACPRVPRSCNRAHVLPSACHCVLAPRTPAKFPHVLAPNALTTADTPLPSACHCVLAPRTPAKFPHVLVPNVLAPAHTPLPSACHCEPVRTLVRQSASPQRNFANWQFLGQIRMHFPVFAQSTAFCHALPQEMRIATSLRSSQ